MKRKVLLLLVLLLALSLVLVVPGCSSNQEKPRNAPTDKASEEKPPEAKEVYLSVGGGPAGGMYNSVASAIAEVLDPKMDNVIVRMEGTAGGQENLELCNRSEIELGVCDGLSMYQAYKGVGNYAGKQLKDVRAVGLLINSCMHAITLQDSGIKTLEDLVGKRVAIGSPGSSTNLVVTELFKKAGIWDKVTKEAIIGGTAITALKDGQVDAMLWGAPVPAGPMADLNSTHDAAMYDILTAAKECGFLDEHPFVWDSVIKGGTYADITEDMPALNFAVTLIVSKDADEDAVYELTKVLYTSATDLGAAYGGLKGVSPDTALLGVKIALHPGAQRAFEELGVTIPAEIKAQ